MGPIAGTRWQRHFAYQSEARSVIEASMFEANARSEVPFADPKAQ
jgi:hypothetical protein